MFTKKKKKIVVSRFKHFKLDIEHTTNRLCLAVLIEPPPKILFIIENWIFFFSSKRNISRKLSEILHTN